MFNGGSAWSNGQSFGLGLAESCVAVLPAEGAVALTGMLPELFRAVPFQRMGNCM
jgi:hypothetical protein